MLLNPQTVYDPTYCRLLEMYGNALKCYFRSTQRIVIPVDKYILMKSTVFLEELEAAKGNKSLNMVL